MKTTQLAYSSSLVAFFLCCALAVSAQNPSSSAATHLSVSHQVILPSVTRLGINLGEQNYFDSGQMLKNMLYRNPDFAGLSYRSIFHCVAGGPGRCLDMRGGIRFPTGFWDGAAYEILDGATAGRRGMVTAAGPSGNGYVFVLDGGIAVNPGDWVAVRKGFYGEPTAGWWPTVRGGGTLTPERSDLAPGSKGRQALRMTATAPGSLAQVNAYYDTSNEKVFVHLHGHYRLSFKAKSASGSRILNVHVRRLSPGLPNYIDLQLPLTTAWAQYHQDFSANEGAIAPGSVEISFSITGGAVLLDDMSLEPVGGDPANHTAFRDEVLETLRDLHPGVLRMMGSYEELGSTIDNLLAPVGARVRSGYLTWYTPTEEISIGIPEFLDLCQAVGAEPWIVVPTAMSQEEARKLAEFFAGSASSEGGALRVASGHPQPWTRTFRTIHFELGNEAWSANYQGNMGYQGESIEDSAAYGRRSNMVFSAIRAAAGADAARFDLAVNTQAGWAARNAALMPASTLANTVAIAPYLMSSVTDWSTDDRLFSPLLAQSEQMAREGILHDTKASVGGRQLAVYEVNLHTTGGTAPESVLDRITPSAAAGVALAGHMMRMMRDFGVRDEMIFSLSQYRFKRGDGTPVRLWGTVVEMGAAGNRRPQFLAASLVNRVLHGDLVRVDVSGENPTHDQSAGNDGVKLNGVHEIDAYGFRDGRSTGLVVFNYGLHQSRRIVIDSPGSRFASTATLSRLVSPSPAAGNETSVQVTLSQQKLQSNEIVLAPCSMAVIEWSE